MGGLDRVLKLKWTSAARVMIHITDAPCHGNRFHYEGKDYKDEMKAGSGTVHSFLVAFVHLNLIVCVSVRCECLSE